MRLKRLDFLGRAKPREAAKEPAPVEKLREKYKPAVVAMVALFEPQLGEAERNRKAEMFLERVDELKWYDLDARMVSLISSRLVGATPKLFVRPYPPKRTVIFPEYLHRDYLARFLAGEDFQHELVHFGKYSNNHYVAANCLSNYYRALELDKEGKTVVQSDGALTLSEFRKKVESAFRKRPVQYPLEWGIKQLKGRQPVPPAVLGQFFGVYAFNKEAEWHKPGAGLFLIREVGKGKPIEAAEKEIMSGQFDAEIKEWVKKHEPKLRKEPAKPKPRRTAQEVAANPFKPSWLR